MTYRIGVAANWVNDTEQGDVMLISPPVARNVRASGRAAAGQQSPVCLLLGAALVFTRSLGTRTNYDEGVYLASLDALRRGQDLGSDVYTSQPPAFYWVLRVLAAPFGSSVEGIRLGFAALALVGVGAAIVLGWRLFGPPAGVAAGASRGDRAAVPVGGADGRRRRPRSLRSASSRSRCWPWPYAEDRHGRGAPQPGPCLRSP